MTVTAARPATYTALLRTRGVAWLYALALSNVVATSLQMLALSVMVYRETSSALWSSTAFAAGFLPQLFGGALLTSLADRRPARMLLVGGALLRGACALLLAVAHPAPALAIGVVAFVAVLLPLPSAAQSALVARLVPDELYVLGRSVFTLTSSFGQLLGLAVGGSAVALLGPAAACGVAAGIQLAGLVAALALPRLPVPPLGRWRVGDTWRGNATLLRERVVRRILLAWWLPITLLVGAESLVVAYAGGQGRATGVLLAAFPAGAAVGDIVVGRWLRPSGRRRAVPWLCALVGLALLPLAGSPPTAVAAACFALASAGTAYQLGGQQAFLAAVPEARRGLAFGLVNTGIMTGQGLGPLFAGALADRIGPATAIGLLGAGVLVLAAALYRPRHTSGDRGGSPRAARCATMRS